MRDRLRLIRRSTARPAAHPASRATRDAAPTLSPKAAARRRLRRRRLLVGGIAGTLALCLVGGGVALAVSRSGGSGYRTATAALGTVEQTIDATGTIASASRVDRAFSVAGTIGSVDVAVGDTVTAGQVLASLDPASVQDTVDQAERAVADAEQRLASAIASQTPSSPSTDPGSTGLSPTGPDSGLPPTGADAPDSGSAGPGSSTPGGTQDPALAAAVAAVTAAQQALLAQHDAARAALADSGETITSAQETCQAFLDVDLGGGEPTEPAATGDASTEGAPAEDASTKDARTEVAAAESAASDTTPVISNAALRTDGSTGASDGSTGTAELTACQDAITAVLAAQTTVEQAQTALMSLATDLDAAVSAAQHAFAAASTGSAGMGSTGDGSGSTQPDASTSDARTAELASVTPASATTPTTTPIATTPTGGSGDTGGASTVATAADLLADQAAIDQAEAELAVAQAALNLLDLTSPITGTVAAVALAEGDRVEASSATAVITVIGDDGYTVSTTVSLAQVDLVEVGQQATVQVTSTDEDLTGTVTGVGILNVTTTSTDPTYTVDIALDPTEAVLFNGSSAQVSIAVAASDQTLTVPSSAVHLDGSTTTVRVLRDGTVEDVEVERGAVGSELTEIVSGLSEGDEVVLADLGQAMVSDDEENGGLSRLGGGSDVGPQEFRGGMIMPEGAVGGAVLIGPAPG